jgi:hypothetical protein
VPLWGGRFWSGSDVFAAPATSLTRWQTLAQKKRDLTRGITWLTHEPIEFLFRRGDHNTDEVAHYQRMLEPENIQRMADAGVKWGRVFFYKGFGLAAEQHHIDQAHTVADQMHKLGMKVSLYIGGTMFIETLYNEIPAAQGWEQRDQWNNPVTYGDQTFRHYACPNETAYREYIKRVIKIGVSDLHADELAFDNIMLQSEPHSCRCARCTKAFTEFLKKRYPTADAASRRFGIGDIDLIRPDQWETPEQPDQITELNNPVLQEWTRFRCQSLANYSGDLYGYVKNLNAAVAVLLNIKGLYSYNRYWGNAVYHPMFDNRVDLMAFDTGGYEEHIDATSGALVSQIRSYKVARKLKSSCEDAMNEEVRAAVHMSFGYQKPLGGLATPPFGSGAHNVFTPLLEFFREYNDRFYTDTEPVADVAVLRTWPSMAYSINATSVPATLMEQVLIQYRVPFDILFDEQWGDLSRYGAVILAGQECVADEQIAQLLIYVRNGGRLILTGNTCDFNEWRETRPSNPLLPERTEGKGKIIYIPQIMRGDSARPTKTEKMTPAQWVLPRNHPDIYHTVLDALPDGLSIQSTAPLTVVCELLTRASSHETIAHFVNFDRANSAAPFSVTMKKQLSTPVTAVLCYSPDTDDPIPLAFDASGDRVKFTVPQTRVYAMIVVS